MCKLDTQNKFAMNYIVNKHSLFQFSNISMYSGSILFKFRHTNYIKMKLSIICLC